MEIRKLEKEDALFYCTRDEDHFFDRKAYGIKGEKIQKIAVAFANADGGEFVVGVADEKEEVEAFKRWKPVDSIEKFNPIIQALNEIEPIIEYRCAFLRQDAISGYVLLITIEKGRQVHETAQKKVIVRQGAQSFELKGNLRISELAYAKGQRSYEDELIPDASIDELESSKYLAEFISYLPSNSIEPLDLLIKQNLVNKEWVPRVASLLLFAENPSAILTKQCAIKIARYNTTDEDPERDDLTNDIFSIELPIHHQINEAYNVMVSLFEKIQVWTLDGLKTISYPKETIWELLVNAVLHRDYSISDNIFIGIFNDRVEIKSPGRLPGFVKIKHIVENRFSRNSKLVRLLSRYPNSPNKDLGEGVKTAFQKMKAIRKKEPEIIEDGNFLKVTIRHELNYPPEEVIIKFLDRFGNINNRQVRDLTGIRNSSTISSIFSRMREKGILQKNNSTSSTNITWSKAVSMI